MRISDWSSDVCSSDLPSERVVIHGGQAGRGKAQHEAVKGEVVETPARQSEFVIFIVAALAMPTVQILQLQHGTGGFTGSRRTDRQPAGVRPVCTHDNTQPPATRQAQQTKIRYKNTQPKEKAK